MDYHENRIFSSHKQAYFSTEPHQSVSYHLKRETSVLSENLCLLAYDEGGGREGFQMKVREIYGRRGRQTVNYWFSGAAVCMPTGLL